MRAIIASGPDAAKPTPLDRFLADHPAALRFATAPKPIPTSFAHEAFFGVSALKFTNQQGASRFGRYRILPEADTEYLSADEAGRKSTDFLFDELPARLAQGEIKFRMLVQLAEAGDNTSDPTASWPDTRQQMELGTITVNELPEQADPELRKIIFDPIPRVRRDRSKCRSALAIAGGHLLDERAATPRGERAVMWRREE